MAGESGREYVCCNHRCPSHTAPGKVTPIDRGGGDRQCPVCFSWMKRPTPLATPDDSRGKAAIAELPLEAVPDSRLMDLARELNKPPTPPDAGNPCDHQWEHHTMEAGGGEDAWRRCAKCGKEEAAPDAAGAKGPYRDCNADLSEAQWREGEHFADLMHRRHAVSTSDRAQTWIQGACAYAHAAGLAAERKRAERLVEAIDNLHSCRLRHGYGSLVQRLNAYDFAIDAVIAAWKETP